MCILCWCINLYHYKNILYAVVFVSYVIFIAADVALLQPHVGHMISFIEHIALDEDHSDSNVSACCGLIG